MKVQATFQIDKILGPEITKQLLDAQKAFEQAKRVAVEAFGKTPEGSLIYKLNPGNVSVDFRLDSSGIPALTARFNHNQLVSDIEQLAPWQKSSFIPETVLNTMLHSKLLNESEKRDLLVAQGYLKPQTVPTVPLAPQDDTDITF